MDTLLEELNAKSTVGSRILHTHLLNSWVTAAQLGMCPLAA